MYGQMMAPFCPIGGGAKQDGLKYWPLERWLRGSQVSTGSSASPGAFVPSHDVVLTPKARNDKRWLVRANGVVDIVPLARKELIDVTAVHGDKVDFTWHWIPNEIGKVLALYDQSPQRATATLLPMGSNWTVLRIEP